MTTDDWIAASRSASTAVNAAGPVALEYFRRRMTVNDKRRRPATTR